MDLERQFVPQCLHIGLELDGPEALPLSSQFDDVNAPSDVLNKFNDVSSYMKGKNYNETFGLFTRGIPLFFTQVNVS